LERNVPSFSIAVTAWKFTFLKLFTRYYFSKSFNVDAQIVGRVEAATAKTITSEYGTLNTKVA
jgi:hypothetical protein